MLAVGSWTVEAEYTRPPGRPSAFASDGDGRDGGGTRRDQRRTAGRQGRTGRDHVVDQQDPTNGHGARCPAGPPDPERTGDIGGPLVAAELELRDGRAAALEGPLDRQVQPLAGHRG